jgi:hypothetical protein
MGPSWFGPEDRLDRTTTSFGDMHENYFVFMRNQAKTPPGPVWLLILAVASGST